MAVATVLQPVAGVGGWAGRMNALTPAEESRLTRAPATSPDELEWTEGDARLARELADDGRADVARLTVATGWSESTVRRRIKLTNRRQSAEPVL